MLSLVQNTPKTSKVGKKMAKTVVVKRPSGLLLSSIEFTATLAAAGRGGQLATARQVPGQGWSLSPGNGFATLGAKRGGQRIFKTLDALVSAASRLGCDAVFLEVPKAAARLVSSPVIESEQSKVSSTTSGGAQ